MDWRVCKLIVDDHAKKRSIAGEVKALLATLLFKGVLTEEEVKSICTWGELDIDEIVETPFPLREVKSGWW